MMNRGKVLAVVSCLLGGGPVTAGPGEVIDLFNTGPEHLWDFNGTPTFVGRSSGTLDEDNPQRWTAQAFWLPAIAHVTEIWADGYTPVDVVNEFLNFEIFSRVALDVPPGPADSLASGAVPFPAPIDNPDGGYSFAVHVIDTDVVLAPGDYWLTVYASNSSPPPGQPGFQPANFYWLANPLDGINVFCDPVFLDWPAYWRSSSYPVPGFQCLHWGIYPQIPEDPPTTDLGNCSFRIRGMFSPPCPWDCGEGDGNVGILDFLALLAQWGQSGSSCDFAGDGVGVLDLLALLAHWGPC